MTLPPSGIACQVADPAVILSSTDLQARPKVVPSLRATSPPAKSQISIAERSLGILFESLLLLLIELSATPRWVPPLYHISLWAHQVVPRAARLRLHNFLTLIYPDSMLRYRIPSPKTWGVLMLPPQIKCLDSDSSCGFNLNAICRVADLMKATGQLRND